MNSSMVFATIQLIVIVFAFVNNWLWVATAVAVWFSFRYPAFVLVPLAVALEGYFGQFDAVPWLSIGSIGWYFCVEELKPYLRHKTEQI